MVFGYHLPGKLGFNIVTTLLATLVLFGPGRETLRSAWKSAIHLAPNMVVLISMGTLASLAAGIVSILHQLGIGPAFANFAGAAGMIMTFHLTGRFIETKAKGRASQEKLHENGATTAVRGQISGAPSSSRRFTRANRAAMGRFQFRLRHTTPTVRMRRDDIMAHPPDIFSLLRSCEGAGDARRYLVLTCIYMTYLLNIYVTGGKNRHKADPSA